MHFEIVSVSHELNQIYSYQLLLNLAMEFIVIICTLYNLYFDVISSTLVEILHCKIVIPIVLFFIFSAKVIIINHECTYFHREVKLYILLYIFTMTKVIIYYINIGIF